MTPSYTCEVQLSICSCDPARWRNSSQLGQPSSRNFYSHGGMSVVSLYWTAEREVGQGRLSYSVRPDDGADHARAQVAVVCRRYVAIGGHLGRTLVGPVDVGELMLGGSRPGVDARKYRWLQKLYLFKNVDGGRNVRGKDATASACWWYGQASQWWSSKACAAPERYVLTLTSSKFKPFVHIHRSEKDAFLSPCAQP